MYIKLDKEYEVKCTLGTIRDIERAFNKGFFEIMKNLQLMKTDEQLKLLYIGVKRGGSNLSENEFLQVCEDNLGIGSLMEILEQYIYGLQYPGLSEEEVQEKISKKLQQNRQKTDLIG